MGIAGYSPSTALASRVSREALSALKVPLEPEKNSSASDKILRPY